MSSKPLSSLNIPKNLLDKLHHNSIYKVKELIVIAPMELAKLLSIPLQKVQLIFDKCFENLSFNPINKFNFIYKAIDITNKQGLNKIGSSISSFDKLINEIGILKKGLLCEVCGPPGVGKTQFLTQLCITNNLIYSDSSIIYIDTENNFSSKRFLEIANENFLLKEKTENDLIKMTKNIFVIKNYTFSEFQELLKYLEFEIVKRKTNLLIIDSLASIVRREFCGNDSEILHERALFLSKLSSQLKILAEYLDISVILSNQIVSISNKSVGNSENITKSSLAEDSSTIPALGFSWSHFVNVRIVLQFIDDEKRELLVAKSPFKPFTRFIYHIDSNEGIIFKISNELILQQNPTSLRIRSKPYNK